MKTSQYCCFTFILFIVACSHGSIKEFDNQKITDNKFKNDVLQEIVNLQNNRNTSELLKYFNNADPLVRETAVLAIGSVQDKKAVDRLLDLLENDESQRIRMAAAFSIGQVGIEGVVGNLTSILNDESSNLVKSKILESLGKCGNDSTLDFLVAYVKNQTNNEVINGAMLGISRLALRNIFSGGAMGQIYSVLNNKNYTDENKYYASIALSRLKDFDLTPYFKELSESFTNSTNLNVRLNLIAAFSNIKGNAAIDFLKNNIQFADDYRIKVNIIKSLNHFDYEDINKTIFRCIDDSDINCAIQASEYFLLKGTMADAEKYFSAARKVKNWRVRTNLMAAALKFSYNKSKLTSYIKANYQNAKNIYEKAALLKALGNDISNYEFVSEQVFSSKYYIIRDSGLDGLAEMRRNKDFDSLNKAMKGFGKPDLSVEFAAIFKKAILSGDIALVAIAAEVIRDPDLDFRKLYKNSYFIVQALNNCKLPQEIETYRELQKTVAFMNGTKEPESVKLNPIVPDWDYISQIPYNQQIEISTSKGKIIIELHVNQAPVSVSNFLKLIEQNYYNNKVIHRTVPNFVVQDGCPRGDGWGGPDYVICSEFAMDYFTEGTLGMASAGKDTESSQWFITNSPTPHLDGKYTNFGQVVKGMEVVHQLEVGDTIKSIEIINN